MSAPACVLATLAALVDPATTGAARAEIAMSALAPGLSILTAVSDRSPRVGGQISIVYSLRAQTPPVAIDVLPQQYTGLWTETVPLGADDRMERRERDGRAAYEAFLRQVVAYPLREGPIVLPPLALRIRTGAGRRTAPWDIEGASRPLVLEVRGGGRAASSTLVGTLRGRLEAAPENGGALLELEGSANLAFVEPERLLRIRGGWTPGARLLEASSRVQTFDRAGLRTLALVERRRWRVPLLRRGDEELRIDDVVIPLASADGSGATELRMSGLRLPSEGPESRPDAPTGSARPARRPPALVGWVLAAALAATAVILWRFAVSRAARRSCDETIGARQGSPSGGVK